jgi:hypothetical protein
MERLGRGPQALSPLQIGGTVTEEVQLREHQELGARVGFQGLAGFSGKGLEGSADELRWRLNGYDRKVTVHGGLVSFALGPLIVVDCDRAFRGEIGEGGQALMEFAGCLPKVYACATLSLDP